MSCSDIFLGLIAILFPPIAVWIKTGLCSADSCINILLCILGYVPGLVHAWYVIAKYPEHDYDRVEDVEGQGRVTYYYISHDSRGRRQRGQQQQQPQNYGTVPAVPGNKPASQQQQYLPSQLAHSLPPQQVGVTRTDSAPSGSRPTAPASSSTDPAAPPPPYSEAVRGDNKIQSQD